MKIGCVENNYIEVMIHRFLKIQQFFNDLVGLGSVTRVVTAVEII